MTSQIFTALRTHILTKVINSNSKPVFKTVELWNNQPEHELMKNNDEKPRLLPACYIEFADINISQLQAKVQQCDFKTILHIVFSSLKDNDVTYMNIKDTCYQYVMHFEVGTCSKFLRVSEEGNYDFPNLRYYQQTYAATLKDFNAQPSPNTGLVTTLTINPSIVVNI